MTQELWDIIGELRIGGLRISDDEAEYVMELCNRKMVVGKVIDKKSYLPLMFKDEIRNYLIRRSINGIHDVKKEIMKCVHIAT